MTAQIRTQNKQRSGRLIATAGPLAFTFFFAMVPPGFADSKPKNFDFLTPAQQQDAVTRRANRRIVSKIDLKAMPQGTPIPEPPPGSKFLQGSIVTTGGGDKRTTVSFMTSTTSKEVYNHYERLMRQSGWQVSQNFGQNDSGYVFGQKSDKTSISVTIGRGKGRECGVGVTYYEKK